MVDLATKMSVNEFSEYASRQDDIDGMLGGLGNLEGSDAAFGDGQMPTNPDDALDSDPDNHEDWACARYV